MSRERDRITRKLEENPVKECNQIQKKFYPELFSKFEQVKDPRHSSYIDYEIQGEITDYKGSTAHYNERTGVHLEPTGYSLSLSVMYINYLRGIKFKD